MLRAVTSIRIWQGNSNEYKKYMFSGQNKEYITLVSSYLQLLSGAIILAPQLMLTFTIPQLIIPQRNHQFLCFFRAPHKPFFFLYVNFLFLFFSLTFYFGVESMFRTLWNLYMYMIWMEPTLTLSSPSF